MKKEKQIYKAALYLRLSRERVNDLLGESDSIVNQEALIRAYLKAYPEISVCHVFKDDGWSGVDFERPAFQKMMQKIYDGEINCVIVKDLSRLGRNHTETGKYISRIFPAFGVRFIAVNDGVDSLKQNDDYDNIIIPFKDLLNDSYSRDISVKTRSTFEMKRKQGLYVSAFPRFGYMRHPENKNKLIIDEEAAVIVREIFQWCIEGMGNTRIAKKLNEMHFPAPKEYRELKMRGAKRVSEKNGWYPLAINRILRDETYTGVMTQGKFTTPNYKVKKVIRRPDEEVSRIEDAFEPIISKKEFEMVQQLLTKDVRTSPGKKCIYPLSGFLFCSDCGGSMIRKAVKHKDKRYEYYVCGEHQYNKQVCFYHQINREYLETAVLEAMNLQLRMLFQVDEYLQCAEVFPLQQEEVEKCQIQIANLIEQKQKYKKLLVSSYTDYKEEILTMEEYKEFKAEYESRIFEMEQSILLLEDEKKKIIEKKKMDISWVRDFKEEEKITELSRRLIIAMIDKIFVSDSKNIKIVFRYEDEVNNILRQIKEERGEYYGTKIEKRTAH